MVKNKRGPRNVANFFEAAKSASPRVNPDLKVRILRDAENIHGNIDLPRNLSWLKNTLNFLTDLVGVPSAVGFAASLMIGACIGFYSPNAPQFSIDPNANGTTNATKGLTIQSTRVGFAGQKKKRYGFSVTLSFGGTL